MRNRARLRFGRKPIRSNALRTCAAGACATTAGPLPSGPITLKISEWYEAREFASIFFGRQIDVDHILPIKGRNVCGLHVHNNLQLLTHEANSAKGNRIPTWQT